MEASAMEELNEQWLLGDIVEDVASSRKRKVVKLGEGESVLHRERSGLMIYSHHGEEWILLQFSEKSTKVKQGKKWVDVPAKREDLWIKIASQEFHNMPDLARRESSLRDSFRNQIDTSIECDPHDSQFLEWGNVEDDAASSDVEDDLPVNGEVAETSMEAVSSSSSSAPSDGARKRDASPEVSVTSRAKKKGSLKAKRSWLVREANRRYASNFCKAAQTS